MGNTLTQLFDLEAKSQNHLGDVLPTALAFITSKSSQYELDYKSEVYCDPFYCSLEPDTHIDKSNG